MSSNPLRLRYLLGKYVSNTCTPRELDEFWKLMSEHSDNDLLEEYFQQLWGGTPSNTELVEWANIQSRLKQKMQEQRMDFAKVISIRRRRIATYVAAASLLLCIAAGWWMWQGNAKEHHVVQNASAYQKILLPDGTRVVLNKKSKLNYPVKFSGATREVFLTGEAFFDVAHDPAKPFMVHTGSFVTKVLGTAFSIRAYPEDTDIKIMVSRGKVQVNKGSDNEQTLGVLLPGDRLVVNKTTVETATTKVPVSEAIVFERDELQLDNVTFDEAAKIISEHYNVKISFQNDALRNCRFTGDFTNDSITQVLDVICTLTNASWKKNEQTGAIEVEGPGCD